jgi:hypothetical protein
MKFARITDSIVVEFLVAPSGFSLNQCFHPDILAHCVEMPDSAQIGDTYTPPVVETPVETLTETPPDATT